MVRDTKLYDRLSISPTASENEIKKAYRKLSIKWHPDKNRDNKEEATRRFQEISEAYSILSDSEKRQQYDQIGMDILNNQSGGHGFDPSDIFSQFFGGNSPFGDNSPFGFSFGGQQRQKKKEDVTITTRVTLKQIYCEENIEIKYPQKNYCRDCDGTGSTTKRKETCDACGGKGRTVQVVRMGPMIQQMVRDCDRCKGSGQFISPKNRCQKCNSNGYTVKAKKINFSLRNGLDNGHKIQMEKKGHIFKNEKTDLLIVIEVSDNNRFRRDGPNLHTEMEIDLYQSLFGFDKILKHLDNELLHVSSSSKIEHNSIMKINGKGMADLRTRGKGDLYIKFKVKYPKIDNLSIEEIETVKRILSKDNKVELEMEEDIKSGKIVTTKTILENVESNNFKKTTNNDHEGAPQCTQQ